MSHFDGTQLVGLNGKRSHTSQTLANDNRYPWPSLRRNALCCNKNNPVQ
jgi:hypothetical protein